MALMDNSTYISDNLTCFDAESGDKPVARRGLIKFGGRAALAGAAAALVRPGVAGASPGPGLPGVVDAGARGSAVAARTGDAWNPAPTIDSRQGGAGDGVYAHIENVTNANRAVFGRTVGVGIAIVASVANDKSSATASKGTTVGSGAGVEGQSAQGVGGKFSGKTAQLQLVPSSAIGPPAIGVAGQLFVDRANRLWFCQGGSAWRQLA